MEKKLQKYKNSRITQTWHSVKTAEKWEDSDVGSDDFRSKHHLDQIDDLDSCEIVNLINNDFLEPMQAY